VIECISMRGTSFTPSCLAAAHLCTVAAPHCTGAILMAIAWPVNLGALGNSLAIWLGISPWQLFFYVFLPPLLLDAAVRIDWYLFKKVGMAMGCRGKQLGSMAVHIPKAAFLSRHPSPSIGGSTVGGPGVGVGGGRFSGCSSLGTECVPAMQLGVGWPCRGFAKQCGGH
jgi:hypothetical protein